MKGTLPGGCPLSGKTGIGCQHSVDISGFLVEVVRARAYNPTHYSRLSTLSPDKRPKESGLRHLRKEGPMPHGGVTAPDQLDWNLVVPPGAHPAIALAPSGPEWISGGTAAEV